MMPILIFFIKLFIGVFIVRFHVNLYRLGVNPIVLKLNELTNPIVLPFRALFRTKRYDLSALFVALLLSILVGIGLLHNLALGLKFGIFILFLNTWIDIVFYSMIIAVIGSWLQTNPRQSVMQIMLSCHEWLLAPIRRLIPSLGGLDFSPIAALFLLNLIRRLLAHLIQIL